MNDLIKLAKKVVEEKIKNNKIISPEDVLGVDHESFNERKAVFVTLKKKGELRACIGTYLPSEKSLAEEIVKNAIGAATKDYRFGPLKKEELPDIDYEIQVLNNPEPIEDKDDLDPERYGIVVKKLPQEKNDVSLKETTKTAVLLPDLEGINNVEKQLMVACRKAGINPAQNKIKVWRFTTDKFVIRNS